MISSVFSFSCDHNGDNKVFIVLNKEHIEDYLCFHVENSNRTFVEPVHKDGAKDWVEGLKDYVGINPIQRITFSHAPYEDRDDNNEITIHFKQTKLLRFIHTLERLLGLSLKSEVEDDIIGLDVKLQMLKKLDSTQMELIADLRDTCSYLIAKKRIHVQEASPTPGIYSQDLNFYDKIRTTGLKSFNIEHYVYQILEYIDNLSINDGFNKETVRRMFEEAKNILLSTGNWPSWIK